MNHWLGSQVYFGLQYVRSGVTREMIENASRVLSGSTNWLEHVSDRLREQYRILGDPFCWLRNQPLIDRTSLMIEHKHANFSSFRIERRKTSGSTGTPFHFIRDRLMTAQMDAAMWAIYSWHGIFPGDRQARFWGMPAAHLAAGKRRITDFLQNRRRLSAFDISLNESSKYFRKIKRFRPRYIYGYPTLISQFVQHCAELGYDGFELGIEVVICTGELLAPNARAMIGEFFNARVVNEYGCTESGVISFSCEQGSDHLIPYALYPEIVHSNGASANRGDTGEVVITDLYGKILPMVRYRLHDLASYSDDANQCSCGRNLPMLKMQNGRVDNFIQTPSGKQVYDALLAYTVPKSVFRFLVKQVSIDLLHALIVPGEGFDPQQTPEACKRIWEDAFGPGMRVMVEVVSEIPVSSSGKLRYFQPLDNSQAAQQSV